MKFLLMIHSKVFVQLHPKNDNYIDEWNLDIKTPKERWKEIPMKPNDIQIIQH